MRWHLLLLLVLAGCAGGLFGQGPNENPYYNPELVGFYQGYEGVEMAFDQFPPTLFYYANAPDSAVNSFPFGVEVFNVGSSYSRGGVFISGFDPGMVQIEGIPIGKSFAGACTFRMGEHALNKLGVVMQCGSNFMWAGEQGNWFRSITARGQDYFRTDSTIGKVLDAVRVDFERIQSGENEFDYYVDVVIDDATFSIDYYNRGVKLLAALVGLSFEKFLGEEYLLPGNTYEYPGGGLEYIDYQAHIIDFPQGADAVPQTFMATNCYMYTTFAAPIVCIDPQPYVENRKVCIPNVHQWNNGQGAPVAISQVIQENTPRRAVFHIEIKNVGGGTVFDPGSLEKCSPYYPGGARQNDLDQVWIGEVRIGDQLLACQPVPVVRLRNGIGRFTCTYNIEYSELNSAYETPLVVELWYGYSKTIQRRVIIKRVT